MAFFDRFQWCLLLGLFFSWIFDYEKGWTSLKNVSAKKQSLKHSFSSDWKFYRRSPEKELYIGVQKRPYCVCTHLDYNYCFQDGKNITFCRKNSRHVSRRHWKPARHQSAWIFRNRPKQNESCERTKNVKGSSRQRRKSKTGWKIAGESYKSVFAKTISKRWSKKSNKFWMMYSIFAFWILLRVHLWLWMKCDASLQKFERIF